MYIFNSFNSTYICLLFKISKVSRLMEYDSFKAINPFDKRCIFSLLMISVSLCLHRTKNIYIREPDAAVQQLNL